MEVKKKISKSKYVAIGIAVAMLAGSAILFSLLNLQNTDVKTSAPSSLAEGLALGNTAPDFTLNDPQKGIITKQTFSQKPLFIFFTATYCTPCQIGAQNLAKYDAERGDDAFNVLIVFVDDKETDEQFVEWKQKFGKDDWYVAKGIDMAKTYQVKQLDTKFVFDKNGIVQWKDIAPLRYEVINPVMEPLLRI
jgi:peroxiredoxin